MINQGADDKPDNESRGQRDDIGVCDLSSRELEVGFYCIRNERGKREPGQECDEEPDFIYDQYMRIRDGCGYHTPAEMERPGVGVFEVEYR